MNKHQGKANRLFLYLVFMTAKLRILIGRATSVLCYGIASSFLLTSGLVQSSSASISIVSIAANGGNLEISFSTLNPPSNIVLQKAPNIPGGDWTEVTDADITEIRSGIWKAVIQMPANEQHYFRLARVEGAPDLIGEFGVIALPESLVAGTDAEGLVTVVLSNFGDRPTPKDQQIEIKIFARPTNGNPVTEILVIKDQFIGGLLPGRSQVISGMVKISSDSLSSDYQLGMSVDSTNILAEKNEVNNTVIDAVVREITGGFVDLYVEFKFIELNSSLWTGDSGTIVITIGNIGNKTASGTVELDIVASTDSLTSNDDIRVRTLVDNEFLLPANKATDREFDVQFPANVDSKHYNLIVSLRSVSGIVDSDEKNNVVVSAAEDQVQPGLSLDDFRMFDIVGSAWTYQSTVSSVSESQALSTRTDESFLHTIRVEALPGEPDTRTRVISSNRGKDALTMDWATDLTGTYTTDFVSVTDYAEFQFSMERLSVAPKSFDPSSESVFKDLTPFSGKVLLKSEGASLSFELTGEMTSQLRLLGFESVLLQSGSEFQKAFKFEQSIEVNGRLALLLAGEAFDVGEFSRSEVSTNWAIQNVGVVKIENQLEISLDPFGVGQQTLSLSSVSELLSPDEAIGEALDAPELEWYTSEPLPWMRREDFGRDWAESVLPITLKESTLQTVISGPGALKFLWRTASPDRSSRDSTWLGPSPSLRQAFVKFLIDGEERTELTGVRDWVQSSYFIPAGDHILDWVFYRIPGSGTTPSAEWTSVSEFLESGVDQVTYVPDSGPPMITAQPDSEIALVGSEAILSVEARGQAPLSYQWQKDGLDISGATNATYNIATLAELDTGIYKVVVSNDLGSVLSDSVDLAASPVLTLGKALDSGELVWETAGHLPWVGQSGVSHDGKDAARSGPITDRQKSEMETTVVGPGLLTFWWKVSSGRYDYLRFSIDGVKQAQISGEVDWEKASFNLSGGEHTLQWLYWKDDEESYGQDAGWVDKVEFTREI